MVSRGELRAKLSWTKEKPGIGQGGVRVEGRRKEWGSIRTGGALEPGRKERKNTDSCWSRLPPEKSVESLSSCTSGFWVFH